MNKTVMILVLLDYWVAESILIDIPEGRHGATCRLQRLARQASSNRTNPHSDMLQHVITRDLHHPKPFDT